MRKEGIFSIWRDKTKGAGRPSMILQWIVLGKLSERCLDGRYPCNSAIETAKKNTAQLVIIKLKLNLGLTAPKGATPVN